jgi:hypothetical protein
MDPGQARSSAFQERQMCGSRLCPSGLVAHSREEAINEPTGRISSLSLKLPPHTIGTIDCPINGALRQPTQTGSQ